MCWVSGPCWLGCLRGWGLRTSLLRLTHFGAVSGGRPGEALRVSWSANSPCSPDSQLPRPGLSARLTGTATYFSHLLPNRHAGACLRCRRGSHPGPLGHFLLTSSWWAMRGVPSLRFPRRNLECPLHKAGQALWALDLTPEEERGPSPLQDRPLPKSEFCSEAHSTGPGMGEDPEWLVPHVRWGCFWF